MADCGSDGRTECPGTEGFKSCFILVSRVLEEDTEATQWCVIVAALLPSALCEVLSCVWTCSVVGVAQSALQTAALDKAQWLICVCLEKSVGVTLSHCEQIR